MRRRRRNQPKLESLSLLSRFLNHVCDQEQVSQAKLAQDLNVSTATMSRWFRGDMIPADDDLRLFANVTNIPFENFLMLKILDNTGPSYPMMASASLAYLMATAPTKKLLIAGLTMIAGIVHLRDPESTPKQMLVSLLDPAAKSSSTSLRSAWLASVQILKEKYSSSAKGSVKLWTRSAVPLCSKPKLPFEEISANDWLAVYSKKTSMHSREFHVAFFNDDMWNDHIAPYMKTLATSSDTADAKLIFDSSNKATTKKLSAKITATLRSLL